MKKTIIAVLCLMLLSGCGSSDNDEFVEITNTQEETEEVSSSDEEVTQPEEEKEDDTNYGSLNEAYIVDIGCTPEQIAALRGELKTAIWEDGPIYQFGDSDIWYGFENYDFSEGELPYIPGGKCTQMSVSMKKLIKDADVYSIETLRKISERKTKEEYDEFSGCNIYVAYCDGYELKTYADNENSIGADSLITIKKAQ